MDYDKVLQEAQEKLRELAERRNALDREINALMQIIEGAKIGKQDASEWNPDNPAKADEPEPSGVTDSIRKILTRSRSGLLPTEIRDALETMGVEGSSSKNLLIHVHKVLRRLLDNDEATQVPRNGKMAYRLLTVMERTLRTVPDNSFFGILSAMNSPPPVKMAPVQGVPQIGPKKKLLKGPEE